MLKFLKKPYPFNDDLKHNAKIIFFISIGILIFLFVFQPLDIGILTLEDKLYIAIGLGIITFLSLSLNLLILPSIFQKQFQNIQWNIRKEILWNLWILFTISSGSFLYYKLLGILEFDANMIINIILIAILPISVLIMLNQERLLRSNLKSAIELNNKLKEKKSIQEKKIHFQSDYMKDNLIIKVSSLLFIRSANNYIEVFWRESENVKSQMIRSSLIKAEEMLDNYKFIFKSHRSFIVNIDHIEKIEGNSQGYKLYFEKVDFPIPVSQNYTDKFREII